jgi:hypothetical protein
MAPIAFSTMKQIEASLVPMRDAVKTIPPDYLKLRL